MDFINLEMAGRLGFAGKLAQKSGNFVGMSAYLVVCKSSLSTMACIAVFILSRDVRSTGPGFSRCNAASKIRILSGRSP
jgi:hypothetical protein